MMQLINRLCIPLCVFILLVGCATNDKPFSVVGDANEPQAPAPDGSGNVPPPLEGCVVNFTGQMQLQISAPGLKSDIIGSRFIDVDPIPFNFDGNNVSLHGTTFPDIQPFLGDDPPADMLINGDVGDNVATGTYDPATGKLSVSGFKFLVRVYEAGRVGETELGRFTSIPPATLTTDSGVEAHGSGPTATIVVDGQPYNASDGSITIVAGIDLPATFGSLAKIDDSIGNGALTAVFKGSLDQDPANCTEGGGTPPPEGASGPKDLSITVDNKTISEIDFGSTLALVSSQEGKTILNCEDAANRGAITKMVMIANSGTGDRKIKLIKAIDTDSDAKDPLCSGAGEFVRGSIRTEGSASCSTIKVGGKDFTVDECTLPEGADNKIIFPLIYMPFNYVAPPAGSAVPPAGDAGAAAGETPAEAPPTSNAVIDMGSLVLEYDDQTFGLPLKGITEPDTSDALSVSKVTETGVSKKDVPSGGQLKIAVETATAFTQPYVIKNSGSDSWGDISFSLKGNEEGGTSKFSITPGSDTTLGAAPGSDNPATFAFSITFNPDAGSSTFTDQLIISLKKVGSTAQVVMEYDLKGTVGEPPFLGTYQLQIDFMTGLINSGLQDRPVESLDFRDFTDQAPKPQNLTVHPPNDQEFSPVDLLPNILDLLNSTTDQRRKALRILNAQGSGLEPGADSSMCNDPNDINKPYPAGQDTGGGKQDCAYFYFDLKTAEGVQGLYDGETGDLTIPDIEVGVQNPYHDNVGGVWPPSQILETQLKLSLTTKTLDTLTDEITGLPLVSDSRIGRSDLNLERTVVKDGLFGEDCVDSDPIASLAHPHFKCYLTPNGKYLQGTPISLRAGETDSYDVVLVGLGRFKSNTLPNEADIPVFLSNNNIYLVIQGRLCPKDADCSFKK